MPIEPSFRDIPYATVSSRQTLDVYLPDQYESPLPVLLYFHGGAFMFGDKNSDYVALALAGLARGFAVVSANYRLSGEAIFPALVHDAKAVVRWIRANAERYRFDPQRVAVWGSSAGSYLAVMLGASEGVAELEGAELGNADYTSGVDAVINWFAPINFLEMDSQLAANGLTFPFGAHNDTDSPESKILGAQITTVPELVRQANPETYLNPNVPPMFIQHGRMDNIVPVQQSVQLADKVREITYDANVVLNLLDGAGHGGESFESAENVSLVFDFLEEKLHLN